MSEERRGRPLGRAERFYWLFDHFSCTNFVILTELDTAPTTEQLQRAFDRQRKSHPLLDVGIGLDARGQVAFVDAPAAPLEVTWLDDEGELDAELEHQLEVRFPTDSAPLLRCTGCRHRDGLATTLLWTVSHALTDAGSAARLVRALVAGTETTPPAPPLPPTEALLPRGARGLHLVWRLLGTMVRDIVERFRVGTPQRPPHWPKLGSNRRRVLVIPIRLDRAQTGALLARCRSEKTTMQGAICAAQLLALAGQFPAGAEPTLDIHSAVSLRPRLEPPPHDDQLGLHISMLKTQHRLTVPVDPWALARDVRQQLARRYDRGEGELVWQLFPVGLFRPDDRGARRLARVVGHDAVTSVVTNLGSLDDPVEGRGPLTAMGFAMGAHPDCALVTAAVTSAGALQLHHAFNTAVVSEDAAREMAATMRDRLLDTN